MKHAIPAMRECGGGSIVNIASDESRYMTGSELVIDGGLTAR
jgi:NAD(P)-dependent dehydrogenase (short-subunit alcohol dehydrogenase family)